MKNKKYIWAWSLFDFANSSYSAVIAAVVFPAFYSSYIVGEKYLGDLLWGRAISLSMFFTAIISPFLGSSRDLSGLKKLFLFLLVSIGSIAVANFCLLKPGDIYLGFILIVIANFCLEASLVVYNAYLPEIIPQKYWGRVSAWGFGLGYLGSILSLLLALLFLKRNNFNLIWLEVSWFWFIFSLPLFIYLPKDEKTLINLSLIKSIFKRTYLTFKEVIKDKNLSFFLLAYFFYIDGVNTVIVFSSLFAFQTLGFSFQELIFLYLLVQITALLGCFILAKPFDKYNLQTILKCLLIAWISITLLAIFITSKLAFWVLASLAGLGLGSIQAGSRAFFSLLIPKGKEGSFFGFYGLVGKSSAILGPFLFGFFSYYFKSQKVALFFITSLFILGYIFFKGVKKESLQV